jgi:hypothetical protein
MNSKLKLWQIGLVVFIFAGLANAVFVSVGIGGLLRELMRFAILAGLGILVFGVVQALAKKKIPR